MLRHLALIGAGGMAGTTLQALAGRLPRKLAVLSVLARPGSEARAAALLDRDGPAIAETRVIFTSLPDMLAARPDFVAECAGHAAVRDHAEAILGAGVPLAVIAIGALAEAALHDRLLAASAAGGAPLILPPGAVGGIDALVAARLSGLEEVTYTGRKPPQAWRGTAAERMLDLSAVTTPVTFYEGTARGAARDYPQNANVAATVALAGAGFEATRVRLVADPTIARNVHEVSVRSTAADFTIRLEGRPSPANPKTSLTAGLSLAREILNRSGGLVI
ncbi:aspartate dehydrogenase [Pseudoroseomonas deserti]|uniref:L-aspartate dehydrogenase n=1 Tax=Teichococcus deserti TaxID=1817963 RepID=A0A1V2H2W9_9PROT|nr:aspartate dehydrogenase [Pseudoroseomonas deserti]ONG54209.1 aspartate dehydrogenase [Pseudoroseomonas deserti]